MRNRLLEIFLRLINLAVKGKTATTRAPDALIFFPKPLPKQLLVAYYQEYIRFLQMPVVWLTVFVFLAALVFTLLLAI